MGPQTRDISVIIDDQCRSAVAAAAGIADRDKRAGVLRAIAAALEAQRAQVLQRTEEETRLLRAELEPEFDRMTGTLRMFAGVVQEGSWVRAAIDTQPGAGTAIGPPHDVRRMLLPLTGAVAVFGASNFPLAYGVCGGDSASAWAAGCGVVVKEHPAHPETGRLIARVARGAIAGAGVDAGILGYLHNDDVTVLEPAQLLVAHESVAAVGFTGSIPGGRAIVKLAESRTVPIPVYAEMGSVNPVFITPGAMDRDPVALADLFADSVLARYGQQCTKPGAIFFARSRRSPEFTRRLAQRFRAAPSRPMLAPWIARAFSRRCSHIESSGAASLEAFSDASTILGKDRGAQAHLWGTDLASWRSEPHLREEAFGPSTIWVLMEVWDDALDLRPGGHLTITVHCDRDDPRDARLARTLIDRHAPSAGRIILNGVPTGVRVARGMVHGGPFPATNRPDTTAVGPLAIERWCRPVCFQNCPDGLLPPELRNANPLGIERVVDGVRTRGAVGAAA